MHGGSANGAAILGLKPPYQLPQACPPGAVAKWTGSVWECGPDIDTATSAIGGVSGQDVLGDGIPDSFATVGQLRLHPGKYAIFAKIQISGSADEMDSDTEYAYCQLTADSDFDSGLIYTREGGDHINGVISLMLLHEFASEGLVDVSCADHGDDAGHDYADRAGRTCASRRSSSTR